MKFTELEQMSMVLFYFEELSVAEITMVLDRSTSEIVEALKSAFHKASLMKAPATKKTTNDCNVKLFKRQTERFVQ